MSFHLLLPFPSHQREHYKLDWHRFNLKQRLKNKPVLSALDFEKQSSTGNALYGKTCMGAGGGVEELPWGVKNVSLIYLQEIFPASQDQKTQTPLVKRTCRHWMKGALSLRNLTDHEDSTHIGSFSKMPRASFFMLIAVS